MGKGMTRTSDLRPYMGCLRLHHVCIFSATATSLSSMASLWASSMAVIVSSCFFRITSTVVMESMSGGMGECPR